MSEQVRMLLVLGVSIVLMILSVNLTTYSAQSKFLKEDLELAVHDASLQLDIEELSNGFVVFDKDKALEIFKDTLEINTGLKSGEDYTISAFEYFDHESRSDGFACENPANPIYDYEFGSQSFQITCPTILAIISYKSENYIHLPGERATGKDIIKGAAYSYEYNANVQAARASIASLTHSDDDNVAAMIPAPELIKNGDYYWPAPYTTNITSHYQKNRLNPVTGEIKDHNGTDISLSGIENEPAVAMTDGVVTYTGRAGGYGNLVEVTHTDNVVTRYAHLNTILVERGVKVSGGDVVGLIGSTGNSTGPHLHFEVIVNGRVIDPLLLFK